MRTRFVDTLVPLFVASLCAVGLTLGLIVFHWNAAPRGEAFMILGWRLWLISVLIEAVLVVPLMLAMPALRKPPPWLAAVWGMSAAFVFEAFFLGELTTHVRVSGFATVDLAIAGAGAGLAYALTARRI